MEKTKLGISTGLLGAVLYVLGLANTLALVVLVGYVLLRESNETLKKMAIKSLAIVLCFTVISAILGLAGNVYDISDSSLKIVTSILSSFNFRINWFYQLISIARATLSAIETILLLLCAAKALKMEDAGIGPVDNFLNKYI